MNVMINQMLSAYKAQNINAQKNAMKEVIQEIVLSGLSRAGFFQYAAFYGGTALRIFYGLDRFSEDLDFSLMKPNLSFDISTYFPFLKKEVESYGLNVQIDEKIKTKDSNIQSAFLKGNTKEHLLLFYEGDKKIETVPSNEVLKIKFEIDINPPSYATFERKYRLRPTPYEVNLYDDASLFAGKIHAVLGRAWKNRIKGRDLYDYVFYLSQDTAVNIKHLRERLIQSNHINKTDDFNLDILKNMLNERFKTIDFVQAKEDVSPFINDLSKLNLWGTDFFTQITDNLQAQKDK